MRVYNVICYSVLNICLRFASSCWPLTVLSNCNIHVKHFTSECRNYLRLINTTPDTSKPVSQLLDIFRRLLFWTIVCNLSSAASHYSSDWDISKSHDLNNSGFQRNPRANFYLNVCVQKHWNISPSVQFTWSSKYPYDMLTTSRKRPMGFGPLYCCTEPIYTHNLDLSKKGSRDSKACSLVSQSN
jgi:hypothetical protein